MLLLLLYCKTNQDDADLIKLCPENQRGKYEMYKFVVICTSMTNKEIAFGELCSTEEPIGGILL
jgi:hypothetical protein